MKVETKELNENMTSDEVFKLLSDAEVKELKEKLDCVKKLKSLKSHREKNNRGGILLVETAQTNFPDVLWFSFKSFPPKLKYTPKINKPIKQTPIKGLKLCPKCHRIMVHKYGEALRCLLHGIPHKDVTDINENEIEQIQISPDHSNKPINPFFSLEFVTIVGIPIMFQVSSDN